MLIPLLLNNLLGGGGPPPDPIVVCRVQTRTVEHPVHEHEHSDVHEFMTRLEED